MARIYYGSFKSIQNITYRVELWNAPSGSATGGTELTLAGNGFDLEIRGNGSAWYESPIRPSKVASQWVMPSQIVLDDFVTLSTNLETYWTKIVYRDNVPFFIGRIVADQMTRLREAIESKPIIDLTAVDGLELLDAYNVQEAWFTDGKITATYLIRKCLENLELYNYWVTLGINNNYFYDATVIYATHAVRKGLDIVYLDINTFVPEFDPFQDIKSIDIINGIYDPLNMINCKQAIENLCINLGTRFMQDKAGYWMFAANGYVASTIAFRRYSYTMQYQASETYSHRQTIGSHARPEWMAKPSLYYQAAVQKLVINQKRQMGLRKVRAYNSASTAAFELIATEIPTGSNPDTAPMRIRVVSKSEIYRASGTMKEDRTFMNVIVWIENLAGSKMQADGSGYWFAVGTATGELVEKITVDNLGTWVDVVFEKSLSTAPIGFDKLYIKIDYVKAAVITFTKLRGWRSSSLVNKQFWGSIQAAFADTSSYKNPDFVYDLAETFYPSAGSSVNSNSVEIEANYYTAPNKFSIGNILVSDGTNTILETDWFAGYDGITHGTLTAMLGKTLSGLYANFVPVIEGTWVDTGSYSPIKSLYFDNYTWLLNGVQFAARAEQWAGEWLAVSPVYINLTTSGEGQRIGKSGTQVLSDRINYQEQAIANLGGYIQNVPNQVLENLVNYADQPITAQPTVDTQYDVSLRYTDSTEVVSWKLQEQGNFNTYTAGTSAIDTAYEGHLGDTTTGSIILDLPVANLSKGRRYYFVRKGAVFAVTINGNGADINGTATLVLSSNYASATLICNGTEWFKIA